MLPPFCLLKPTEQRKTGVVLDFVGWSQSKAMWRNKVDKMGGQAHSGCRQLVTGPTLHLAPHAHQNCDFGQKNSATRENSITHKSPWGPNCTVSTVPSAT